MLRKVLYVSFLLGSLLPVYGVEKERSFKSSDGKEIRATFLSFDNNKVTLRRNDGKTFDIPIDRLSKDDIEYVKNASSGSEDTAKAINEAAGFDIVSGTPLERREAEELASALKLKPESTSSIGKSWRLYASFQKGYTLFGAMPYSVALYSREDGTVQNVSIVYANKGDFGSTAGFAEDHFKSAGIQAPNSLEEAMELDFETVSKALSKVLGEGVKQRYGESATRRDILRWDWNGYSFLLSNEENEYVSLAIVSTETADNDGKTERVSDMQLKERLAKNVVRKDNGDVYISEIPMVDQGPKGYCVPATFERAMRTMGISADMYLLAMVGQSGAGGGTVVEVLVENVKSAVYRKGRRTKDDQSKDLKIRDVKRYIDDGIPVMWTMHSSEPYNKLANENTKIRKEDSTELAQESQEAAEKLLNSQKPESDNHICMIIGYNEKTDEFAVSDSWGKKYELRWIPVSVANWTSDGKLFMILP